MPRKRVKTNEKAGRPIIPIDWQLVKHMCRAGAAGTHIATRLGMHPDTFYDRVAQEHGTDFTRFRMANMQEGDDLLRMKQFEMALKGDRTMLIWLGKNRLQQRDKHELTGKDGASLIAPMIVIRPENEDEPAP